MEKEKLESLLIDYIDNKLLAEDRKLAEQELVNNPQAYKLYEELKEVMHLMDRSAKLEPRESMQANFETFLQQEIKQNRQAKTIFFQPAFYRAAAAVALLILGGAIGYMISNKNNEQIEPITKSQDEANQITQMMAKLANDQSASQRIQGVKVALRFEKADDEIVDALAKAMNEDPNTNVRLAALEALSKFVDEPKVRQVLINGLQKQKDPHVQIVLIQILVKMKEKGVVNDLQKIIDDEHNIQAVKDEAYSGILRLS